MFELYLGIFIIVYILSCILSYKAVKKYYSDKYYESAGLIAILCVIIPIINTCISLVSIYKISVFLLIRLLEKILEGTFFIYDFFDDLTDKINIKKIAQKIFPNKRQLEELKKNDLTKCR